MTQSNEESEPVTGAPGYGAPGYGAPYGGPGQAGPGYGPPYGQPGWGQPYPDPLARSRIVAGILGLFLGSLGIHRFYLGYTGIGVLQIVLTVVTCGVAGLWGFVEGILYLVSREGYYSVDADGRPLTG